MTPTITILFPVIIKAVECGKDWQEGVKEYGINRQYFFLSMGGFPDYLAAVTYGKLRNSTGFFYLRLRGGAGLQK